MNEQELLFHRALSAVQNRNWAVLAEMLGATPSIASFVSPRHETLLLELAGVAGSEGYVRDVVRMGGNPDVRSAEGETALGRAISRDSGLNPTKAVLQALLEVGADPNAITSSGSTPLLCAIEFNKPDHFKILLKLGADPDVTSNDVFPTSATEAVRRASDSAFRQILEAHLQTKKS